MAYQAIAKKWRDLPNLATILATKSTATSIAVTLLCTPLKEDEHHLWLAVITNNLAACETLFFYGKLFELILFETTQLKQLYNPLHESQSNRRTNHVLSSFQKTIVTANLAHEDEPVIQLLNGIFETALQKKMPGHSFRNSAKWAL